MLLSAIIYDVP